jgi:hypothetical protein
MKKALSTIAIIAALAMPSAKVEAHPVTTPGIVIAGSGPGSAMFLGAVGAAALVTYLIATDVHFPLCDMDGVTCEYSYPGAKAHVQAPALSSNGFGKPYHE